MTFDEMGDQYDPRLYGAYFDSGFALADHSNSTWGRPHSGTRVLVNRGLFSDGMLKFRIPPELFEPYPVYSLSGYFSTAYGKQILVEGIIRNVGPACSALIGGTAESWDNVHVTLRPAVGTVDFFMFYPINSPEDMTGFCIDDMTVDTVPEPSAMVVLFLGLGAAAWRWNWP